MLNTRVSGAASKRIQSEEAIPADTTLVTQGELEALGYRTLGDALAGILGFRSNQDTAYQQVGVLGVNVLGDFDTRVLILLDGHALNNPAEVGSSKVGEDFGIPIERIARIEVVRGPASSLYGSNAFLGMVNVVTKDAEAVKDVQGALTADDRGLREGWVHAQENLGHLNISFTGTSMQRGGFAYTVPELQPQSLPADADREYRQSAYLRIQDNGDIPWSLSSYVMSRQQHVPLAPFGTIVGDDQTFYQNRQRFFEGRVNPKGEVWEGFVRVYGDYSEYCDALPYDGSARSQGNPNGFAYDVDPDRSLGFEAQARRSLGRFFYLTFGTEQSWHRFDGEMTQPGTDLTTQEAYRIQSYYAQLEAQILPSLSAVAGVQRTEHSDFKAGDFPRLALVWQPREGSTLKALSSQGLREPTIYERFYDDGVTLQNPGLHSERIFYSQGIWHQNWVPGLQTQVSCTTYHWVGLIQSLAISDVNTQFQNLANPLDGRALQVEARWQRGIFEYYGQFGSYTARMAGQTFPNTASTQGALRAICHLGSWSLAGEWREEGPRSQPLTGQNLPATSTLRVSVRCAFPHGWAQLTGENVGNTDAKDFVAQDYAPVSEVPVDQRTLRLTLGFRL
jgi:outer membrane cobalamin receptor